MAPYPPERKAAVLQQLQANHNNVALTSIQTGVPERTIRDWRRKHWLEKALPPQGTPAAAAKPALDYGEETEALKFVRQQIIQEVVSVASNLADTLNTTAPYHRILALTQLLDRLIKLDAYIPETERERVVRFEFQYPDGSIHDVPEWHRDVEEDDDSVPARDLYQTDA